MPSSLMRPTHPFGLTEFRSPDATACPRNLTIHRRRRVNVLAGGQRRRQEHNPARDRGSGDPTEGRVTVAGMDVVDLDLTAWWRQLACNAPNAPGTAARYRRAELGTVPDHWRTWTKACRASGFDEVPQNLPNGLATVLGRGAGLSMGERQRLVWPAPSARMPRAAARRADRPPRRDHRGRPYWLPSRSAPAPGQPWWSLRTGTAMLAIADHVITVESDRRAAAAVDGLRAGPTAVGLRLPRLLFAVVLGTSHWAVHFCPGRGIGPADHPAWQMPPVFDLSVAVVAVRLFGVSRGVLGYFERLVSHDVALVRLAARAARYTVDSCTAAGRQHRAATAGSCVAGIGADVDALASLLVRGFVPIGVAAFLGICNRAHRVDLARGCRRHWLCSLIAGGLAPWLSARAARAQEHRGRQHHSNRDIAVATALDHAPSYVLRESFPY